LMIVVLPVIVVPEEKTVEPAGEKAAAKISCPSVSSGGGRAAPPLLTIVCPLSELFAMPVLWIVSVFPSVLIVKAPPPAPKLIPAALMAVASVTVPPVVPTKFAVLPSVQLAPVCATAVVLHEKAPPVNWKVAQVPLPALAGVAGGRGGVVAFPVQNRSTHQALGSTQKINRAVMNATRIPESLLWRWAVPLVRCVFMETAVLVC
jgi:hypothetical protein